MKALDGITGLLGSRKGTLSLIITALVAVLSWHGSLDSVASAAIIGTVATIFMWTNHKVDIAAVNKDGK